MRKTLAAALLVLGVTVDAFASPVAYWRFEAGPANTDVIHTIGAGQFEAAITDDTGNGNHLSVWEQGGGAGYRYRTDVPYATLPLTSASNTLSVKNTGGGPAMFTTSSVSLPSGVDIETMTPAAFTVEASWKPESGGYRTVVGRDARNVATSNGSLAALYLQARPNNSIGILFVDVAGNVHEAFSEPNYIQGFNFGSDPDGLTGMVERIGNGGSQAFHSMQELWAVLSSPPPDARRGIGGNHD